MPELISIERAILCQLCLLELPRMSDLQRHLAAEHPERPPPARSADPPPSTVDASAISDPRDTCAGLLPFKPPAKPNGELPRPATSFYRATLSSAIDVRLLCVGSVSMDGFSSFPVNFLKM